MPVGFGPQTYVTDLAGGPDGFVAVGADRDALAIWTSPDGRTWSTVNSTEAGFERGLFTTVIRDDRGWLAVGQFNGRPTHDGAVWRSADGVAWQRMADAAPLSGPDEVELWDVIAHDGGYLLVGNLGSHEERVACDKLLAGGARLAAAGTDVALSCGWGVRTHWWSPNAEDWQLLPPVAEAPGEPPLPVVRPDGRGVSDFGPIRAGGPGLVTLAYEIAGRDAPNDVRAIWTTADARTWSPLGAAPQLPPGASVSDMVVVGRRIAAVGTWWAENAPNAEDGRVWIGTILP